MTIAPTNSSGHGSASKAKNKSAKQNGRKHGATAKPSPDQANQKDPGRASPRMADVDKDVLEFIAAIEDFKLTHARPFPSWSEVLGVVRALGYERK